MGKYANVSSTRLLDEDLRDIFVVVESRQMQRREAVLFFHIDQLPCSGQDLFCGPASRTETQHSISHIVPDSLN